LFSFSILFADALHNESTMFGDQSLKGSVPRATRYMSDKF